MGVKNATESIVPAMNYVWNEVEVEEKYKWSLTPKKMLWGTLSSLVTFVYATISLSTKIATLHILTTPHNKYLIYYFAMH